MDKETTNNVKQGVLRNDKDLSSYLGGASCELLLMLRNMGLPFHKFGKTRFYFPHEIDQWIQTHGETNCSCVEDEEDEEEPEEEIAPVELLRPKHININYGKNY